MESRQIIRMDEDSVDDVVITGDMLRIERMDDDHFWVAVYRGHKEAMFSIYWDKKAKKLRCNCYSDTIGCIDDREKKS